MKEPKQKPAGKPVRTADKACLPRTAMRAVWLRTREGTRRLVAEEHRDGQYQEASGCAPAKAPGGLSRRNTGMGSIRKQRLKRNVP